MKQSLYKTSNDDKRLHLCFIQDTITRLASNSFQLKSWYITIIAGCMALILTNKNKNIVWIIVLFSLVFLFVDAYYLCLERQYRKLYEKTCKVPFQDTSYNMVVEPYSMELYLRALLSIPQIVFYIGVCIAAVLISLLQ